MAKGFVGGGAFLCSVFLVIRDRLTSRVFIDYFDDELVNKLEITLNSIKKVVEDAETKQYQNLDAKNWLDDLKHELYELDQVLDVVAIDAQRNKIGRFVSGSISRFESRIKELLKRLNVLVEQKNFLGLQEDRYEIQLSREFTNSARLVFSSNYGQDRLVETCSGKVLTSWKGHLHHQHPSI
ncbi:hypothetical protein P8452_24614 [Trifolium repens]|nr:hypothetical protein P8452_24614 [Trifolium repens]